VEVHLATALQNIIFDRGHFPKDLYGEIVEYLKKNHADEKKEDQTEEQFLYKVRKKAFGPFKKKMWDLPLSTREAIGGDLKERFEFFIKKLKVGNTLESVVNHVETVKVAPGLDDSFRKLLLD